MDVNVMLSIRAQGMAQFTEQNIDPCDVVFVEDYSSQLHSLMIPYEGSFPPSHKHVVRKQVAGKILDCSLHPLLHDASYAYFFSYEPIYDLDYAFVINMLTNSIDLYFSRNGKVLKQIKNYQLSTDERPQIMNL